MSHSMCPGDVEFFRSVLARDPGLTQVYADLAEALLAAGDCEGAIVEASAGIDRAPHLSKAWLVRASARKRQCDYAGAAQDFERAAALEPSRAAIFVNLANCYAELGRLDEAEHVLRRAVTVAPGSAAAQASLASVLVRQGRLAEAEVPCRAALLLDPALVEAHQNLSGILAATDPAAARHHRDAAYRRQQIFVESAARPERTVLVLSAADAGNVPLQHLMPRTRTTLIRWYIEYASGDQDQALPPYDLIFNAIGEADFLPVMPTAVVRVLREQEARVINHPAKIALTGRADLPGLLRGIPDVVVPAVVRCDGSTESRAAIRVPVLARPLGAHGGEGVRRIDDEATLAALPDAPGYFTQFVDTASDDGWYRKYRMIFVDGCPYPYHLAIGRHWMVHHWTTGMERDPVRLDEERRFLEDPETTLGATAMAALAAIGERLGLDYAGVDFARLPDGQLLVFEANATMLAHPEPEGCFAYRNAAFRVIQSAFDAMLRSRSCRARHVDV